MLNPEYKVQQNKTENTMKNDPIQEIDSQILDLNRRKAEILSLIKEREKIDSRISKFIRSGGRAVVKSDDEPNPVKGKKSVRRGSLTAAAFSILKENKGPMNVDDLVEKVKESPLVDAGIPDIDKKIRNVVYSSKHLKVVGRGVVAPAVKKLEGTLFENLTSA